MIQEKKINNLRVLVAPLNWGLGHVTRCIPIINQLEKNQCEVIVAANDNIYFILKKEFPSMQIIPFLGYDIHYSNSRNLLFFKLLLQFPKIAFTIYQEHKQLKKIILNYQPDILISDNRFGMYNPGLVSIYLSHQLTIKTGNPFADRIARIIHNQFIKKYDQCWIPDFKENGLAGELSHPKKMPINAIYIGALSRFEKLPVQNKIYDLLVSISGPEPQRTIFENIILHQLKYLEKKVLVVRGLPGENKKIISQNPLVTIVNHLPAMDLNLAFQQTEVIICRSGYTTIMDLIKIGKSAIIVPTPGQPEQEYLASYLMEKKTFFSVKQKNFKLEEALTEVGEFTFVKRNDDMDIFKTVIAEFLLSVKSGKFETM